MTPRGILRDVWILGAVAAALALRLVRLDAAPLWLDEVITAQWVPLGWADLLRTVAADNHPPLYFVGLKAWVLATGAAPWDLRLPSVFLSAAAVALVAVAGDALGGRATARWGAWFAALSPYLVQHAQEARMYALVTLLAAANVAYLVRWVRGTGARLGVGFVLSALGMVASHYYTVFFLGGEVLALLVVWRRPLASWLPAAVTVSVASGAALLAAALLAAHKAGGAYEMGMLAVPGAVWAMIAGYTALPDSTALHAQGAHAALRFLPFALGAAVPVGTLAVAGWRALDRSARLVVLVPFATTLAAPFAVRLVLGVAVNPRYFMATAPGVLLWLAAGASRSRVAGAALAVVLGVGLVRHLADPGHGREDTRAAGAWLAAHVPAGEEVLVTSGEMELLARFHWPARRLRLYPPQGVVASRENADRLAAEMPFPGGGQAVLVVGREWLTDPTGAFQAALESRYTPCVGTTVRGIRILCLRRSA
ncbi:MAG: hypothetical protein U0807_16545 [Candidatus Binatia bacterium]